MGAIIVSRLVRLEGPDGEPTHLDASAVAAIVESRHRNHGGVDCSAVFLHGVSTVLQVRGTPDEVRAEVERQVVLSYSRPLTTVRQPDARAD